MAAPVAPVPDDSVSPTPRSKIRARMASGATSVHQETFVRLGNSGWCSIPGPIAGRSSAASASVSVTRIAVWGLPISTCWYAQRRPPASSSPSPRSRARPMSTVQRVSDSMRGRSSPATVWMENSRASVHPRRCRYMIASRAPLPESSASEPSGLKIRRRATNPGSSAVASSSTPSAPTPRWRSHSSRTRSAVRANGSAAASTTM